MNESDERRARAEEQDSPQQEQRYAVVALSTYWYYPEGV
jgi:hypothetical protein